MEITRVSDSIFWIKNKNRILATVNLTPGTSVYGERLIKHGNKEYREWNPNRSKIAAAIYKGYKNIEIHSGSSVLYLGASTGTTVSHVSDIIGEKGVVYAVEISEEVGIPLVLLAEKRRNIFPIIYDAAKLEDKKNDIEKVDFIYQDIAQKNQIEIFIRNANLFLKSNGRGAIAIKARSIDVLKDPNEIIYESRKILEKRFKIEGSVRLDPFQKDHTMIFISNQK
ncbi:MAG: fibrillarin-like rRNA/tRNA 2'-O-methyltransferase [Nanoarchaeota archaeon]|nr:fibrillarin-like rRNA/tRNA 2'-O-methyltransferase [Nanoarchaeota archaeon]